MKKRRILGGVLILILTCLFAAGCGETELLSSSCEFSGKTISMTQITCTDIPYPTGVQQLCSVNGYAVYFDSRTDGGKTAGWNALDRNGNVVFSQNYAAMTNFDFVGTTLAWEYPRFPETYVILDAEGNRREVDAEAVKDGYEVFPGYQGSVALPVEIPLKPGTKWGYSGYIYEGVAVYAAYAPELPGENDHLLGLIASNGEILIPAFIPAVYTETDYLWINDDLLYYNDNGKISVVKITRTVPGEEGGNS